jgi:phenylacetate-CoA ligase
MILFHTQVGELLKDIPELSDSYLLVVTRERTMDEVEVRVELEDGHYKAIDCPYVSEGAIEIIDPIRDIRSHFIGKIKGEIGLMMKVGLCAPESIPRSDGGKPSRIKDLRKKP